MKSFFCIVGGTLAVLGILSEAAYRVGALLTESAGRPTGSCTVVTLGYPSRADGNPHPVQRLRVRAAVATFREHGCDRILFSGGAARNRYRESETMAAIASSLGIPKHSMVLETHSRTTWENIGCSVPHLEAEDRLIILVSDSLHVHRAKNYACRQIPDHCSRIVATGAEPPLSLIWWKVPGALHELGAHIRDHVLFHRAGAKNAPRCPAIDSGSKTGHVSQTPGKQPPGKH